MKTQIYQICYSPQTFENVPEGFLVLDNLANERVDWREYWAIRKFLLNNHLSEDILYGFFSPKFQSKTTLDHFKISEFLKLNYKDEDVVSFSPFWDLMSIFKNVFEQGDFFHAGLTDTCQMFANQHIAALNLKDTITHSENTIFCNYFLAKKSFWQEWLSLGELLFNASENQVSELAKKLNDTTSYGKLRVPMKVFVQERLATICLLANKKFNCLNFNSFLIGASTTPFNKFYNESVISDALKRAYAQTGNKIYLNEFSSLRDSIIQKLSHPIEEPT
jgi:hypothetical protein